MTCLLIAACASRQNNTGSELVTPGDYESTVEDYSARKQVYDGLYAVLELRATLLNSKVRKGQLDQNARLFQWDETTYQNEKAKMESDLSQKTEVFLSFFTPDSKQDNLSKAASSWNIFLDAGGKRYQGKATKMKGLVGEITAIYPMHSRFSTPYKVSFPVPTSIIENSDSKLTLTGPIGSTSVDFSMLK